MRQTKMVKSRRTFLKTTFLGLGALRAGADVLVSPAAHLSNPVGLAPKPDAKQPGSDIRVWFTNGKQRFAAGTPIPWQAASTTPSTDSIRLIEANRFQDILGFGGGFSYAPRLLSKPRQAPAPASMDH